MPSKTTKKVVTKKGDSNKKGGSKKVVTKKGGSKKVTNKLKGG